jgi:hypothetical protein
LAELAARHDNRLDLIEKLAAEGLIELENERARLAS